MQASITEEMEMTIYAFLKSHSYKVRFMKKGQQIYQMKVKRLYTDTRNIMIGSGDMILIESVNSLHIFLLHIHSQKNKWS